VPLNSQERCAAAREELAREDCHDPFAGFAGALTFRLILASFGLIACSLGAAAFVIITYQPAIAGILAFFATVAVVDIIVVARPRRRRTAA
jgi:hypothetical protein